MSTINPLNNVNGTQYNIKTPIFPIAKLNQGNWLFEDIVDFYWELSKSVYFGIDSLVCKCQYFGKDDICLVEQIEQILNPLGLKIRYSSLFQTIKFAKEHKQRNSISDSIAERLLNIHALYVAAGQKHSMEDVNSMLATATIIYIEHINSLVKSGRLHDYDYFDKDGKEVAQLMGLETPTQFSTFMRKQEIYLIKALVRYTLFPAIFSGPSVSLKSHSALLVEKPKFLPLDLSDIEICMALMIGRHGTAMTEKLDECILNVISNFILESKSRGYRYPDTYIINKSTPDWLLASILSDMLNLDMGVPEYMASEIQASKDIYKKLQKISAPLALPEPIFAPTKTKPQETSTTSTGGSPTRIDPKLIDELVMVVNDFPVSEDKNLYIQSFLDSFFPEISKENKN